MSRLIFIDIDGTMLKHPGSLENVFSNEPEVLDGVIEKIQEWHINEDYIVVTTSRPESLRNVTIRQLEKASISYDQLMMGVPKGCRVIINDKKPGNNDTIAIGIELERNQGLRGIELP